MTALWIIGAFTGGFIAGGIVVPLVNKRISDWLYKIFNPWS